MPRKWRLERDSFRFFPRDRGKHLERRRGSAGIQLSAGVCCSFASPLPRRKRWPQRALLVPPVFIGARSERFGSGKKFHWPNVAGWVLLALHGVNENQMQFNDRSFPPRFGGAVQPSR